MKATTFVLTLLPMVASACGSSSDERNSAPSAQFVSDTVPGGPSISIRTQVLSADNFRMEIFAQDIDNLYGVATRVHVDAAVLQFEGVDVAPIWSGLGDVIAQAKEGTPGTLVLVVTRSGKQPGLAAKGAAIATLQYKRLKKTGKTPIRFASNRSAVMSDDGKHVTGAAFVGGSLNSP